MSFLCATSSFWRIDVFFDNRNHCAEEIKIIVWNIRIAVKNVKIQKGILVGFEFAYAGKHR